MGKFASGEDRSLATEMLATRKMVSAEGIELFSLLIGMSNRLSSACMIWAQSVHLMNPLVGLPINSA